MIFEIIALIIFILVVGIACNWNDLFLKKFKKDNDLRD